MYQKGLCTGTNMFYSKQFHCHSNPHQNQYLSTFMDMVKYMLEFVEISVRFQNIHWYSSALNVRTTERKKKRDVERKRNV